MTARRVPKATLHPLPCRECGTPKAREDYDANRYGVLRICRDCKSPGHGERATVADRLSARTVPTLAGCWLWLGGRDERGYGQMGSGRAHRIAYALAYGSVPAGLDVHHVCHVRHCVNPQHLVAVTHERNTQERRGASKRSLTGARGVSQRGARYFATVKHAGRNHREGPFGTIDEAAKAASRMRDRVFGHTKRRPS